MAKAVALSMGFYKGKRIREGQEFEVPAGTKGKWFTVEGAAPEKTKKAEKAPAKAEPETKPAE